VEIKPLNNGTAPISASVDELRATVENLSLSPIGALSVSFQLLLTFHRPFSSLFLL
jgi:F-BAR domain only protein